MNSDRMASVVALASLGLTGVAASAQDWTLETAADPIRAPPWMSSS